MDEHRPAPAWVVALDVIAKVVLLVVVLRIAVDPAWGNLEGKEPGTRAMTYPLLALLVPVGHAVLQPTRPYPWGADLLMTLPAFSDLLGNRLDLYDRVVWFDDVMHVVGTGALSGAVLLLCGATRAPVVRRLEVAVASGMTFAVAWELWEYYAFVTRSAEASTAYADTVGDLVLGWVGAVSAGLLSGRNGTSGPVRAPVDPETVGAAASSRAGRGGDHGHHRQWSRRRRGDGAGTGDGGVAVRRGDREA